MPKDRAETEAALRLKFKKIYGCEPSGSEFTQFKKNYRSATIDDESEKLPAGKADDDHPFLRNTRSGFNRRARNNSV